MDAKEQKSFTDLVIKGLKKAVTELEEFRVQAALGKAEARDMYEDLKKQFNHTAHELKLKAEKFKSELDQNSLKLRNAFESLQVQLALGKAETKETFEQQRKAIIKALNEIESIIKSNKTTNEYYITLLEEIEKFKIKLEILRLRFELKRMDVNAELEDRKNELKETVNSFKEKILNKENAKMKHFSEEVSQAYAHIKKAFNF